MGKMDVAAQFFHACEGLKGSAGCADLVADGATFRAQSEPIAEITSLLDYCDWMKDLGEGPLAGCQYKIINSAFDDSTSTGIFFAVLHATHSGDGGPVEPTGKSVDADYVYAITVNDDGKVSHMTKIWNAPWSLRELGWM